MSEIKLESLHIENFKGVRELDISFADKTEISGANATGKSTCVDAFMWLLFGKDSQGRSDFQIRPVDADGKQIDNIEIGVEAKLDVDGAMVVLGKRQKQNWVKRRGSNAPTFQGNTNTYSINDFPASQKEYDSKVSSIVDEALFRMLTNPRVFPNLKWQDQRKQLLQFAGDITDDDILDSDVSKYEPIAADVLEAGADKAREKANALLRDLKKKQAEYPVRIDEAMRSIVKPEESLENLNVKKATLQSELETIRNERDSLTGALKAVTDTQAEILKITREICKLEALTADRNRARKAEFLIVKEDALTALNGLRADKKRLDDRINILTHSVEDSESLINELKKNYKEVQSLALSEKDTSCPTCGRPFDEDRISEIRQNFAKTKAERIANINATGMDLRKKINENQELIGKLTKEAEAISEQIVKAESEYKDADDAIALFKPTDVKETEAYQEMYKDLTRLEDKLADMDNGDEQKRKLTERETAVMSEIAGINKAIATHEANDRTEERIAELRQQQIDCSQKVADQEQMVYLLDEFMKAKMDMLSDVINQKFKVVRWKLFETQINGAVKEVCTSQIASNGCYVDYANANNAAQIQAGLDIINALSELYGVTAPIFVDNAEAVNDFNFPEMKSQVILLKVTDDKELVITNA